MVLWRQRLSLFVGVTSLCRRSQFIYKTKANLKQSSNRFRKRVLCLSVWQSYLQLTSIPKPGKLGLPSMSTKTPSNNGQVSITKKTRREQRKTSLTCLNRWCHTNGCCHSLPWVLPVALLCFISSPFAETLIIFTERWLLYCYLAWSFSQFNALTP